MSILSSTNAGLKSIKVNVNFLLERGYYFKGSKYGRKLVCGSEPHGYLMIHSKYRNGTEYEESLCYSITLSIGKSKEFIKIEIENLHDLLLLEHFWKTRREEHSAAFQELKKLSIKQGFYKIYN